MWQRLQPREKIMLAVLGIAVLGFVLVKFLLIPQVGSYGENKARLKEMRLKVQAAEAVIRSQKKEAELFEKSEALLNEIKPAFDKVMNDGLALVYIGLKAEEAGVEIIFFKPAGIIDRGVYLELPFEFKVQGDYPNVIDFISYMEGLPDLSEVRRLNVAAYKGKGEAGSSGEGAESEIPTQKGKVVATFDVVTFTSPAPEARLKIEQVIRWAVGRYNSFQTPGDLLYLYPVQEDITNTVNSQVYN